MIAQEIDATFDLADVGSWHEADVQRLPGSGPLTAALPTFGAECRFTDGVQT